MSRASKRDKRFEDIEDIASYDDDSNSWAVAYGDVISVLLTFLFLILSISEINARKFEEIKQEMKNQEKKIEVEEIYKKLKEIVKEKGLSKHVDIKQTMSGVEVNIGEKLLFSSGSAQIKTENTPSLNTIVSAFKSLPQEYRFSIEGHTDDLPIRTERYPSNWHLSADRALSVLNLFFRQGFSEKRFSVEGKADTKPLFPVFDKARRVIPGNREKNRRVLIKVQ